MVRDNIPNGKEREPLFNLDSIRLTFVFKLYRAWMTVEQFWYQDAELLDQSLLIGHH